MDAIPTSESDVVEKEDDKTERARRYISSRQRDSPPRSRERGRSRESRESRRKKGSRSKSRSSRSSPDPSLDQSPDQSLRNVVVVDLNLEVAVAKKEQEDSKSRPKDFATSIICQKRQQ